MRLKKKIVIDVWNDVNRIFLTFCYFIEILLLFVLLLGNLVSKTNSLVDYKPKTGTHKYKHIERRVKQTDSWTNVDNAVVVVWNSLTLNSELSKCNVYWWRKKNHSYGCFARPLTELSREEFIALFSRLQQVGHRCTLHENAICSVVCTVAGTHKSTQRIFHFSYFFSAFLLFHCDSA